MKQTALPSYENPPVVEVVCGVQFTPLRLLIPHYGELWERFKPDYSECQETSPLTPAIERFDNKLPPTKFDVPSDFLPRVWFSKKDGSGIVQVQRDRFLHNWKKTAAAYPRYDEVIGLFEARYATFRAFLESRNLGPVELRQYEMTYINHMPQSEGWKGMEDFSDVFPDYQWQPQDPWQPAQARFLPSPEGCNLRLNFRLPEQPARLHVAIRNGMQIEDSRPVLLMELTVRGISDDKSVDAMRAWFDNARKWIVCAFADLTSKTMQDSVWRRTE